jgi:hypothetical protein
VTMDTKKADPKFAAFCWALVLEILNKDLPQEKRDVAEFAAADTIRRNLHRWRRRSLPQRPLMLPDDDDTILDLLAKSKPTKEDRRTLNLWSAWRDMVWASEQHNEAAMLALMRAIRTFVRLEVADALHEVVLHLKDEFDLELEGPIRTDLAAQRIAAYHSKDMTLLTPDARYGERQAQDVDEHPEDDDELIERGLGAIEIPPPREDA